MLEKLEPAARGAVQRGRTLATLREETSLEAHHLLLALAESTKGCVAQVMASMGAGQQAIVDALERESAAALVAVGVQPGSWSAVVPGTEHRPVVHWGQSAKLALIRAHREATDRRDRTIRATDLLVGIVGAEAGIVPRVLRELDLDAAAVREAVRVSKVT